MITRRLHLRSSDGTEACGAKNSPELADAAAVTCKRCLKHAGVAVSTTQLPVRVAVPYKVQWHTFSHVSGVAFPNDNGTSRQDIIATCYPGEPLALVPDPGCPFDQHAVKILRRDGQQIGHVTRHLASELQACLIAGHTVPCCISELTGGTTDKPTRGVNIFVGAWTPPARPARIESATQDLSELLTASIEMRANLPAPRSTGIALVPQGATTSTPSYSATTDRNSDDKTFRNFGIVLFALLAAFAAIGVFIQHHNGSAVASAQAVSVQPEKSAPNPPAKVCKRKAAAPARADAAAAIPDSVLTTPEPATSQTLETDASDQEAAPSTSSSPTLANRAGGIPSSAYRESHPKADAIPAPDPSLYVGPRGGVYHYSASGKKVYEKHSSSRRSRK